MIPHLKNTIHSCFKAGCFLFLATVIPSLEGVTSGAWTNPNGSDWNISTNWVLNNVPNGIEDAAVFFENPSVLPTVTSGNDITLGALYVGMQANPFTIDFGTNHLIFNAGVGRNATIFSQTSGAPLISTILNPIVIESPLEFFQADNSGIKNFSGPISSTNDSSVSFMGAIELHGANTYPGSTLVSSIGVVFAQTIGQPCFLSNHIYVAPVGVLLLDEANQFTSSADVTVYASGEMIVSAAQQCNKLTLLNGLVSLGVSPSSFHVKDVVLSGEAFIGCDVVINPLGSITFDPNLVNFVKNAAASTLSFNRFDLSGSHIPFVIKKGKNSIYDVIAHGITVTNGTLDISGGGILALEFNCSITNANITNATVYVNTISGGFTINAQTIRLFKNGVLGGVDNLGNGVSTHVINHSGVLAPGFQKKLVGSLNILGNYTQRKNGTMEIKLIGLPGVFDQLLCSGQVTLDGTLSLSGFPAQVNLGDSYTIIDNSAGVAPISGKFSKINTIMPSGLKAVVHYNPQTVVVTIEKATCPSN